MCLRHQMNFLSPACAAEESALASKEARDIRLRPKLAKVRCHCRCCCCRCCRCCCCCCCRCCCCCCCVVVVVLHSAARGPGLF
jgi:hypothetical protein